MTSGIKTLIYPVKDLAKSKALFAELVGKPPEVDQPYYVGFSVDGQQVGLNPRGHAQGATGVIAFWHVDDIEKSLQTLLDGGAQVQQALRDVGGGKLVASVKDADGNVIGLLQEA